MGEPSGYTIDIFGAGKSVKASSDASVKTVIDQLEGQGYTGYKLSSEGKYRHKSEKLSNLAPGSMMIFPPVTFAPGGAVPQRHVLQSLHIQNYKALADRTFHFNEGFTVIFGDNLCGKTSLIEAIALFGLAINNGWDRDLRRPVEHALDVESGHVRDLNIQFNDLSDLPGPLSLDSGSTRSQFMLSGVVANRTFSFLFTVNGILKILNIAFPFYLTSASFIVPASLDVLDRRAEEAIVSFAPVQLRNVLASLMAYSDYYGAFLDFLARQFGIKLRVLRTFETLYVAVKTEGDFKDITVSGGSVKQIVLLCAVVFQRVAKYMKTLETVSPPSYISAILLDEPDTHVSITHTSRMLTALSSLQHILPTTVLPPQVFMISHSSAVVIQQTLPDSAICSAIFMLRGTHAETDLLNVDEVAIQCRQLGGFSRLADLLLQSPIMAWFEGTTDKQMLSQFFRVLGPEVQQSFDRVFPAYGESGRPNVLMVGSLMRTLKKVFPSAIPKIVVIMDRDGRPPDYLTYEKIEMKKAGAAAVICWSKKEIENYLLDPALLATALHTTQDAVKLTISSTSDTLWFQTCARAFNCAKEDFPQMLVSYSATTPLDATQAILDYMQDVRQTNMDTHKIDLCGGKELLDRVAQTAGTQMHVLHKTVFETMRPSDIHPEVLRGMAKLFSFTSPTAEQAQRFPSYFQLLAEFDNALAEEETRFALRWTAKTKIRQR